METLLALPEGGEWIVLLVVVVLLFGANRLPELTRNTARALLELKKITREADQPPVPPEPSAAERAEASPAEHAQAATTEPAQASTTEPAQASTTEPAVERPAPAAPSSDAAS